jgi:molybdopterin-guanine dinucleotide biosynthesis protein MobB
MTRRPHLLKLVGASGAGKTTLAEALIRRLARRGLCVGYVKHAAHGFELDRPGKDSARAAAAGAAGVLLVGPRGLAYLGAGERASAQQAAERFFPRADLVLVEGFRAARVPMLLFRPSPHLTPPRPGRAKLGASGPCWAHVWATREEARRDAGAVPAFGRDEVGALVRLLLERLGATSTGRRAGRASRR